ncbi:MAG: Wzz/FepE/Etk N-terminal domain-containing protein [Halomonas sp.]|nr:Wzz/FepE/Etk N-terminal domain-containing protein [Halomonas sp.]
MEDTQSTARQSRYDDEIDLIDLWLVLMRRKWIVITVFVLTVLAAGVLAMLTPPRFQTSAVIEVGEIYVPNRAAETPGTYLENPQSLIARLVNAIPPANGARIVGAEMQGGKRAEVENIIVVNAAGGSAEGVQGFLASVVSALEAAHAVKYASWLERQQAMITQTEDEIASLTADIERLGRLAEVLTGSEPTQAAVLEIERARMRERLTSLHEKLADREFVLANSTQTQVLKAPALPSTPVNPQPKVYLTLAVVLGMFLGIVAAFVFEFLAKARQKMKEAG